MAETADETDEARWIVEEIATRKDPDLTAADLAAAVKTVMGTARSMGIEVVG